MGSARVGGVLATAESRSNRIWSFVDKNPGCTAKEIAAACHTRPMTVGTELQALQRAGLVEMRANGRRHEWHATGVRL